MVKLLVLIIAHDQYIMYAGCQESWRDRMEAYVPPEGQSIDYYFLKCEPELKDDIVVENNNVWVKYEESIVSGIYYKTLKAFEHFTTSESNVEYDYILRCNVTSFFLFDRLFQFLEKIPKMNVYAGCPHPSYNNVQWASGAGYIMSRDVVEKVIQYQNAVNWKKEHDDPAIGYLCLQLLKVNYIPFNYLFLTDAMTQKELFQRIDSDENLFHLRIRAEDRIPGLRNLVELGYHTTLNLRYYLKGKYKPFTPQ